MGTPKILVESLLLLMGQQAILKMLTKLLLLMFISWI